MKNPKSASSSKSLANHQNDELAKKLILASKNGELEEVQKLVAEGAGVNWVDQDDFTPLHSACESGHEGVINFLLDNGANPNQLTKRGTPFSFVCIAGKVNLVRIFLDKGVDANQTDYSNKRGGYSALYYASGGNHIEVVKLLLDRGADVNLNKDGKTALENACYKGNKCFEVVEVLIKAGADVNKAPKSGFGPIAITTCSKSHDNLTRILAMAGAKFTIPASVNDNDHKKKTMNNNIALFLKSVPPQELLDIKEQDREKFEKIQSNGVYQALRMFHQASEANVATDHQLQWLVDSIIVEKGLKAMSSKAASRIVDSTKFSYEEKFEILDAMINSPEQFNPLVKLLNSSKVELIKTKKFENLSDELREKISYKLIPSGIKGIFDKFDPAKKDELNLVFTSDVITEARQGGAVGNTPRPDINPVQASQVVGGRSSPRR